MKAVTYVDADMIQVPKKRDAAAKFIESQKQLR
jgi:hypothetical protein